MFYRVVTGFFYGFILRFFFSFFLSFFLGGGELFRERRSMTFGAVPTQRTAFDFSPGCCGCCGFCGCLECFGLFGSVFFFCCCCRRSCCCYCCCCFFWPASQTGTQTSSETFQKGNSLRRRRRRRRQADGRRPGIEATSLTLTSRRRRVLSFFVSCGFSSFLAVFFQFFFGFYFVCGQEFASFFLTKGAGRGGSCGRGLGPWNRSAARPLAGGDVSAPPAANQRSRHRCGHPNAQKKTQT